RPYDALFARAILPGHAPGRPAQPPGASGGRDGCLVSQEEPNLRRHARRCPPRDLAGTGFPHVPDRARGEETPTRAARRHHLRTLPRRMTATKRPNSNLGDIYKARRQPPQSKAAKPPKLISPAIIDACRPKHEASRAQR